jgi:NAD(P)-dependent dehydrogenase (short-subunit alcohol dehydrogenase family)
MSRIFDVAGKVAVITGAGNGIGRAVARSLAARGCNVALADVSEDGMEETTRLIGGRVNVTRHQLDVSDAAAVAAFPEQVIAAHGGVDILVNNAGVGVGGTFEQISEADFDWLMNINLFGVVRMSRAFLPELKKGPRAQLVNVSSILGIVAPPNATAYSMSKFGIRGFSESLRHELEAVRSSVGVTVVHPGGIRTSIVDNARFSADISAEATEAQRKWQSQTLLMDPERAGEIIVSAIEKRKARILVGSDAKLFSIVERIMPVSHWSVIHRLMKLMSKL